MMGSVEMIRSATMRGSLMITGSVMKTEKRLTAMMGSLERIRSATMRGSVMRTGSTQEMESLVQQFLYTGSTREVHGK